MTNEEANRLRDEARRSAESASAQLARTQAERDAVRAASSEKAAEERRTSPKERAEQVAQRNASRKAEGQNAVSILSSKDSIALREISKEGGSLGRRLDREIRRFEQTGRVSSWLAGETIKAEAAQNAAQQAQFRQAVVDVISTPISPIQLNNSAYDFLPPLHRKPELKTQPEETPCIGLGLYKKSVGNPPTIEVWVGAGSVSNKLVSGFDPIEGMRIASGGSGQVWVKVTVDQETGEVGEVEFDHGSSTPENDEDASYYTLGYFEYQQNAVDVVNYGCGSIEVTVCRNWFAAEAPFYGLTLLRSGCGG